MGSFEGFHELLGPMLEVECTQVVVAIDKVNAIYLQIRMVLGWETERAIMADKQPEFPNVCSLLKGQCLLVQDPQRKLILRLALNPYEITSWGLNQTVKLLLRIVDEVMMHMRIHLWGILILPCTGWFCPHLDSTIYVNGVKLPPVLEHIHQNVF